MLRFAPFIAVNMHHSLLLALLLFYFFYFLIFLYEKDVVPDVMYRDLHRLPTSHQKEMKSLSTESPMTKTHTVWLQQ